jgi:hypothetical protein
MNPVQVSDTIATIGSLAITEKIIQYRIATEAAYENTGLNRTAGLIMLVNDALESEFAKTISQQALPQEVELFKEHADKTSKAPEILAKIKKEYGDDISSYNIWYISPKIVNRKIREYFSKDKYLNQEAFNKIKPTFRLAKSGKSLKVIAKSSGLSFSVDSIPVKPAEITPALQNYPDAGLPFENPMIKYVKKLKEGEIYPEIIDENYSFLVIKLIKKTKNWFYIERISIAKPDFDTWYKSKAERIPVKITDDLIKRELKSQYGNVWWVKNIN